MAISDSYTTAEKQWVKILTVDPRSRRIEGALKDRTPVQISLYEISNGFRWPQEGEWWLIYRENREWFLRAPLQRSETGVKVEDLNPGDTLLGAEGAKVVVEGDLITADNDQYIIETDSRLSNSRIPTGPAGGELVGNYPNPELAIIRGRINADGTVALGSGFTSERWLGVTGIYLIEFDEAFSTTPIVTFVPIASEVRHYTLLNNPITDSFRCVINDADGTAIDTPFNFMAIGS